MIRELAVMTLIAPSAAAYDDVSLEEASENIRYVKECRDIVGLESSYSYPIPALSSKGLRFRQMFYRKYSNKGEIDPEAQVMPPRIFAEYDLGGTDLTCELEIVMPKSEFGKPIGAWRTPATLKMSRDRWLPQYRRLISTTETLGKAYAAGRAGARTRAAAKEFRDLFDLLSEPGLREHYRMLSPEFWKWLRDIGSKRRPIKERDEHPLEAAAGFTRYAPHCAKMVPPGHSPSLPIPIMTEKGLRYQLMYYPNTSTGAPLDAIAYPPTVVAQFDAGDTDYSCSRAQGLSSKDFTQPLGPAVSAHVKAMSSDEYDKLLGEYYSLLDVIGPAFAAGKSDPPTRALGQRFRAVFDRISAPALRGSYLALSPKFWAWLRDIETKRRPIKARRHQE